MSEHAALAAEHVTVEVDGQVLLPASSVRAVAGRAVALRGRNGAGKTTLLRVLAGSIRPTSGRVLLEGQASANRSPQHRAAIAAMIGDPPMARELTLREQLRYVRALWGDPESAAAAAADSGLAELDIGDLAFRYGHELSSGQRQLFATSLTLVRPSSILLLDEPEQRLDAHRRGLVAAALRRRLDAGTAVVFATHSASLPEALDAEVVTVGRPE